MTIKYYIDPATKKVSGYPADGSLDSIIPSTYTLVLENDVQQALANQPLDPVMMPVVDAASIRSNRTDLLTQSDWTQLSDTALSAATKASWATYRQALRDITKQSTFPNSVVWPIPPA